MARIIAVCSSEKKGISKENVGQGVLKENFGLVGDAHADCCSHRQTSLLDMRSIEKMRNLGLQLKPGDFAENLTTEGIDLVSLPIGTIINIGDNVMLEITQIGKECHKGCAIFKQVGKCIMPKEGVFARVVKGGPVKTGDEIRVDENNRGN
jgi:MOSC domain-containing protein YiiM